MKTFNPSHTHTLYKHYDPRATHIPSLFSGHFLVQNKLNLESTSTSKSTTTATVLTVISSTESCTSLTCKLLIITLTSLRPSSHLTVSSRNNLGRKSKIGPQILNSLGCKVNIVVLPVEGDTDIVSGCKRLDKHEDFEVSGSLNVGVGSRHSVLFDNEDSLTEEILEDGNAVRLGDEHGLVNETFVLIKLQLDRSDRIDCWNPLM
mmetsp:Transcript_5327/g.10154  ORF Transcript_5327/g.10154 Transcript_5327/m.10154 type:complete len:205 (-) Transcript_5327:83-697(-)